MTDVAEVVEPKKPSLNQQLRRHTEDLKTEFERAGLTAKVRRNGAEGKVTLMLDGFEIHLTMYKLEIYFAHHNTIIKGNKGGGRLDVYTPRQVVVTSLLHAAYQMGELQMAAVSRVGAYIDGLDEAERAEIRAANNKRKKEEFEATGQTTMTYDEMDAAVKALFGEDEAVYVTFSAKEYIADDMDMITTKLTDVVVQGKVQFIKKGDDFWGGEEAKDYVSAVYENPTWADITRCANTMIQVTGDGHHRFLENVYPAGKKGNSVKEILGPDEDKSIQIYTFSMGS